MQNQQDIALDFGFFGSVFVRQPNHEEEATGQVMKLNVFFMELLFNATDSPNLQGSGLRTSSFV